MILWECLCYVLISSVIAVTVGCLYSLTILKMSIRQELLSTGWVMTYQLHCSRCRFYLSRTHHSGVARSVLFLPQREEKRGRADTANGNVRGQ